MGREYLVVQIWIRFSTEATAQYKEALCKQMTNRTSRDWKEKVSGVTVEEITNPSHNCGREL